MNKLTHSKLFPHVFYLAVIAAILAIEHGPIGPMAPETVTLAATASATEIPAPAPTAEPTPEPTPEPLCDWIDHWSYFNTMWPSLSGFSFTSVEMTPKPVCATVVKVDVPNRGAFNFFYFRSEGGAWFVSPPIEAIWGTDSLVYPLRAASDGNVAHFVFYDLRNHETVDVVTDSEAVGLIVRTPTSVEEVASAFPQQPCGLPVEVELVEQILPQISVEAATEWFEWTTYGYGCNAYSTLFVTSGPDTTQYTWLSDGQTLWGPIERDGDTVPYVLRWKEGSVTLFDFLGSVWSINLNEDGSFDLGEKTRYNQALFDAALASELECRDLCYLETLAEVFPLDSAVEEMYLEGWITLRGGIKYLIAYYLVGTEDWDEAVWFADENDTVVGPVYFDAGYIHFDWRVEIAGAQTIVTSCTAGLTKETGTINTFTIRGNVVTLDQKPGTCR